MLQVQSWVAQPTLSVNGNSLLPEQWNQRWKEGGDERPSGNLLHFSLFFGNAFPCSHRFSSIQFSLPVMSNSLRPMDCSMPGFPVPSPTPRAYSNSCPSSQWCHPTISSSVATFSSCPQLFPESEFTESDLHSRWPKYWSFSFSISPSNEYSGLISFRIDCFDLLAVQRTLKSFLQHHCSKRQFFGAQLSLWSNSHIHTWLLEKP